jgi:hypothetical protein
MEKSRRRRITNQGAGFLDVLSRLSIADPPAFLVFKDVK